MAILYEVTSTKQCQQVAMIKQPTEYSNICSTFRAISGLNYWSIFYWVEMLLITEKPLFILFFFFHFFLFFSFYLYLIYVTAFTWTILINRLSFPYFFFFYKALYFVRKMKCTTLRTEALSCAEWSCHCYNIRGKSPCRSLKSIRSAQVHSPAIHYLWNAKHADLGHVW